MGSPDLFVGLTTGERRSGLAMTLVPPLERLWIARRMDTPVVEMTCARTMTSRLTPERITTKTGGMAQPDLMITTTRFIEGWRAARGSAQPENLTRVRRFLEGVRPFLRVRAPKPAARPEPSIVAIRRFFDGLASPLALVRRSGSLIDIWSVAGIRRRELPNAAVLAWLLDVRGSHGQGPLCLSAVLDFIDERSGLDLSGVALDQVRVQPEERPLGSDRDRVDIVVETPELLIFIEVKIDAVEGRAQLSRYVESAQMVAAVRALADEGPAKKTLTLFLSPRPPTEQVSDVIHLTWRDLASVLTAAARRADGLAAALIRSFAAHTRSFG